ncbi:hypothetical protein H8356DRAFT_1353838 [Neocallimastix lanati (nom. inval.)]|nr:hypothetical protein H8356DRAFT_1353838 [Neocallimastix sp. JGI-2020a]
MIFVNLGYKELINITKELERHSKKKGTVKILSSTMHVRVPMLKQSVRSSNRDIICLYGNVVTTFLNIPNSSKGGELKPWMIHT